MKTHWPRAYAGLTLFASLVMASLLFWAPHGLLWGDEGVKLIQTQSLAAHAMASDALIYPGARFDPEWRHFPLGAPFVIGHGETRHSMLGLPAP